MTEVTELHFAFLKVMSQIDLLLNRDSSSTFPITLQQTLGALPDEVKVYRSNNSSDFDDTGTADQYDNLPIGRFIWPRSHHCVGFKELTPKIA